MHFYNTRRTVEQWIKEDKYALSWTRLSYRGLPAAARNDGGHPEIIGGAGVFFTDEDGIIKAIEGVTQNYAHYQAQINPLTLDEIEQRYYEFARSIHKDYLNGNYHPKQVNLFNNIMIRLNIMRGKAQNKLQDIITVLRNKGEITGIFRTSLFRTYLPY